MRIQGELKGLGIGVSATTIATVLRNAGSGRRRGGSAPAGLSSCAPRRTAWSPAICAWRTPLTASLPSRAHRSTFGRARWWKPTTRVLWPLLPRRCCLLTRRQCRAALSGRAFSVRRERRCASSDRIARMLATDPTARRRCSYSRDPRRDSQSHRRSRATSTPATHRITQRFQDVRPSRVGGADQTVASPNRVSLPHTPERMRSAASSPWPNRSSHGLRRLFARGPCFRNASRRHALGGRQSLNPRHPATAHVETLSFRRLPRAPRASAAANSSRRGPSITRAACTR
jgi:hypothetical protein